MLSGNLIISVFTCAVYRTYLHIICHFFGRQNIANVKHEKYLLALTETILLAELGNYLNLTDSGTTKRGSRLIWDQHSEGHPLDIFLFNRPYQIL